MRRKSGGGVASESVVRLVPYAATGKAQIVRKYAQMEKLRITERTDDDLIRKKIVTVLTFDGWTIA